MSEHKSQVERDLIKAYDRIKNKNNWCQGSSGSFDPYRGVMRECATRAIDVTVKWGMTRVFSDASERRRDRAFKALWAATPPKLQKACGFYWAESMVDEEMSIQNVNDGYSHRTIKNIFKRAIQNERNARIIRGLLKGSATKKAEDVKKLAEIDA